MDKTNDAEKLDIFNLLHRLWKSFRSLWILVLVVSIAAGGLMYLRAKRSYAPYYEARAVFTVTSGYGQGDIFTSSQHYDSAAAITLAESFPHLLNTDIMRDLMRARLGKSYINGSITAECIAETNLFEMKVRSSDPQDAYDILCAVIECYPQVAVYMVDNPLLIIREEPSVPTAPVGSFSGTGSLIKGLLAGLVLSMGLVLVKALLTKTVIGEEDLHKLLNLPLLATIPHVSLKRRRTSTRAFISPEDDPRLEESFRNLRVKIRKLLDEQNRKVVLLTSTVPGEGKSTICANLALSLAAEGHRVVLLDADLRNQTIFRMFGSGKAAKHIMDRIQDSKMDLSQFLTPVEGTTLSYISGASTRKRHYSLDSKTTRKLLELLQARFDYIIVDSPPCGVVSDTATFCRYADCVVYVVRQDHAAESQILDAVESLHQRDIALAGCIMNDVPRKQIRYGYGYGYGYGNKKKKRTK